MRHLILVLSLLAVAGSAMAQGAFGVVSEVDVQETTRGTEVRIAFNLPLRYAAHSPESSGVTLQIELDVVSTAELDADILQQRQVITAEPSANVPLQDVSYEGLFPSRPTVLLHFSRQVEFKVRGGSDFRSVVVTLLPEAGAPREPAPAEAPAPAAPPEPQATRPAPAAPPAGAAAVSAPSGEYVINLASSRRAFDLDTVPRAAAFEGRRLYTTRADVDGTLWHRLRLGFFTDAESAKGVAAALEDSYPQAWVARASKEERARFEAPPPGGVAAAPVIARAKAGTATARAPAAPSGAPASAATEEALAAVMEEARVAMTSQDYPRAIQLYTKVLATPGSKFAQEAQELLGLARERNGQLAHAKAEYERYLQSYPEGEGADRVRQRLAGLVTATAVAQEPLRQAKASVKQEARWDVFGSFSQFYRRNDLFIEDQPSTTTLSTLFSDLSVTARRRSQDLDLRTRFTGGYDADFLDSSESEPRVAEMYVDAQQRKWNLSAKIGRQTRSSGGVLGRFDGGLVGYGITPEIVANVVFGYPVTRSSDGFQSDRYFYGVSFDLGTFANHWDFDVYYINQLNHGIGDREAVGGEARFFMPQGSVFSLVDYDISYNDLNTVLLVGTWTLPDRTTINLNLDYRNSPILTTMNALIGQPVLTIPDLLNIFTEDEVRQLADDRTAKFSTMTLGATRPITEKFQIAGDVTVTKQDGTPASGGVPATPGTDYEWFYFLQFTGSSLIKTGDIGILGFRYGDQEASDTYTVSLNARYPVTSSFRINPRLDWLYRRSKIGAGDRRTLRPFLQLDYTWKRRMRFEAQAGADIIEDDTPTGTLSTRNLFASIGYRIDF